MKKQSPKQLTRLTDKGKETRQIRTKRLAIALRKNLRRRKLQQDGREKLTAPVQEMIVGNEEPS